MTITTVYQYVGYGCLKFVIFADIIDSKFSKALSQAPLDSMSFQGCPVSDGCTSTGEED